MNSRHFLRPLAALRAGVAALAMTVLAPLALGQEDAARFPSKPVHIVVPFAPGGAVDILARLMGQKLGERWGQSVVIDNRGGAGGNIAADFVAKAPPDGYTLFIGTNGTHATNAALYKTLPYNPVSDFAPIGLLTSIPHVLVVAPELPVASVRDLVALAKKKPGDLKFGSAGNGSSLHLSGELFKRLAEVDMVHVPYKGGAPAVVDLMAGRIDLMFAVVPIVISQVKAGRVKALAVTSRRRTPLLPDLPTLAESGVAGGETTAWTALLAPARTSRQLVDKINADVRAVLAGKEVQAALAAQGFDIEGGTPEDLAGFIRSETTKWGAVVRASGATVD